jgi:hypothetical protein
MKVNYKLLSVVFGGFLAVSLGYIFFFTKKSNTIIKEKEIQYVEVIKTKTDLEKEHQSTLQELNEAELKIHNLSTLNLTSSKEITALKKKVKAILYKSNITKEELSTAKNLISQLNTKIENHIIENEILKGDNVKLIGEKEVLQSEKVVLTKVLDETKNQKDIAEDKVKLGSTLSISDFKISGLNEKGKVTSVVEKVEVLKLSFIINENRISESGMKSVFFIVIDPSGKSIESNNQSGLFVTEEGEKKYTSKSSLDYTKGSIKNVNFEIQMDKLIYDGFYQVLIYENGMKIGSEKFELKKKKFLGIF